MVPALLMERGRNSVWNRKIWRYDWEKEQSCSMFRKNPVLSCFRMGIGIGAGNGAFQPRKSKVEELFGTERGLEQAWVR